MGRGDHVPAAGHGDEYVPQGRRLIHGHDPEALHGGVQRLEGVHFRDDHVRTQTGGPHGDALAAPAVARHHHGLPRHDEIGGMQDAVPHGLTGAVLIIIVVLGLGVVHRHHGTGQAALPLPGLQPQDAGGGLLAAAQEAVPILRAVPADEVYQVSPVVDEDVGTAFQRLPQEAVVPRRVHAVDTEGLHPQGGDPRRHVVLGGQRVGTGEEDLRSALFQHQGQVRGLGLQMHGNGDALPRKGLFPLKTGLDPRKGGHEIPHPADLLPSGLRQRRVLDDAHFSPPFNKKKRSVSPTEREPASAAPYLSFVRRIWHLAQD